MNWRVLINGLREMAKDIICQKIVTRHLPLNLLLPDLTGLNYIVTGASSGIGQHTARELAKAGANVFMARRNTKTALQLAQEGKQEASMKPVGAADCFGNSM